MQLGVRLRKAVLVTTGISLVICFAFFDVQMHVEESVLMQDHDFPAYNVSTRHLMFMFKHEKNGSWFQTKKLPANAKGFELKHSTERKEEKGLGNGGLRKRLPGAIIIGVKKGGTRALLEILRLHPDVVAPGPEIHFFDRHYDKGLEWYRTQMPHSSSSQMTIEKTPGYFACPEAPKRIANMSRKGEIRLLLVVRDPVTRALSDYAQAVSKRPQDYRTFEDMAFRNTSTGLVDPDWIAIRLGQYAKHLERWLKFFPRSRILVVSGERLVEDPVDELRAVQKFLGIRLKINPRHFFFNQSKGFPCLRKCPNSRVPRCLGKTKGRSHPQVAIAALQRLRDFFRPFNLKFYKMVGRDFGWL